MTNTVVRLAGRTWQLGPGPAIMGILNVTPDSFSDGGQFASADRAVAHGLAMVEAGADLIDVGGESTRPGATPVPLDEELARVVPVVRELARRTPVLLSIDTRNARVARAAVDAGAHIVNDVSGLRHDADMLAVVRGTGAACVAMHMRGTPATMQTLTDYADVVVDIHAFFRQTLDMAEAAGVSHECILLDPGIGFGKTARQSLQILHGLERFADLGRPLVVGVSRKSFIGKTLGLERPADRQWGTAAAVAVAAYNGAHVLRVHDVREMKQVAEMAAALRDANV